MLVCFIVFILSGCSQMQEHSDENSFDSVDGISSNYQSNASPEMFTAASANDEYAMMESEIPESKSAPQSDVNISDSVERMIIRNADLKITVLDALSVLDQISILAEGSNGYVVSSSSGQQRITSDLSLPYADIRIRVPSDQFDSVINQIENMVGDNEKNEINKNITGQDVTSDYIDTKSQLTSLEKTRDKLYEIMDTAQNAEETLMVYEEIADVESQIEVLKGQIKYIEESAAMSAITVRINSIYPDIPIIQSSDWAPIVTIQNAWHSLINGAKGLVDILIYIIIVFVPLGIVIGIPVFIIIKAVKKHNRKVKKTVDILEVKKKE